MYYGKTMVLWKKLLYYGQNYSTIEKPMVYYSENYGTSIYEGKKHGRLPKTMKLIFIMEKNYGYLPKKLSF